MKDSIHIPVLLNESVTEMLNGRKTGIYIDATLGGGGSSETILKQIDRSGRVIGIDQDPEAIEISTHRLKPYANFKAVRTNFRALDRVLKDEKIDSMDGIIFDLGVSSMQLEDSSRGFSFRLDAQLNMRMDQDSTEDTACDLLKNLDEKELRQLFWEYGEDRWAGRIASKIVELRKTESIETTAQLAKLIEESIPKRFQSRRIHPATRFFQALRIAVNEEMQALEEALEKAIDLLSSQGRIVVISYHSLEDRIVKRKFRDKNKNGILKIITKKPITPNAIEIEKNPRSRSGKMRVAEKI